MHPDNILTIAGSDSGAGAGMEADLKTIMALGAYGLCAITALTAQSGLGVAGISAPEADFVALQIATVRRGFSIKAAKTGMLFSAPIIRAVARALVDRDFPLVVDPVAASQSGSRLLADDAAQCLASEIVPGCDLVTPNLPEAELLAGISIATEEDLELAGEKILGLGAKAALIKGGHWQRDILVTDYLFRPGQPKLAMPQARVETNNNHGTGCTLSAAIATGLGQGLPLQAAIARAQRYLNLALRHSYAPGLGCGPVNHAAGARLAEI